MNDKVSKLLKRWKDSLEKFIEEAVGVNESNGLSMSTQQRMAAREVSKLVNAKRKQKNGKKLTPEEQEYAEKIGVSIMSGQGCHARGTKILMHDGYLKNVEDISIGDKLMGNDNTPRNVLSLAHGNEQMYRVTVNDGSQYDVNESHILSLISCESGIRGSLKKGNVINVPLKDYLSWSDRKKRTYRGYKVGIELPKKDLLIPPYILGLWLGDGDSNSARFINKDPEPVEAWKEYGHSLGLSYVCYDKIDHRINGIVGHNNPFMDLLRGYNLVDNKHIPSDYLLSSREDRLELLAGLIDTDGSNRKKGAYSFSNSNKQLAEDVLFLVRSLGFRGRISKTERDRRGYEVEYNINISRGDIESIPVRIERKRAVSTNNKSLCMSITVEPLGIDDYYGFELDGNHLYVLGDFNVTHNTGKDAFCSWVMMWWLCCFPETLIPCTAPTADQIKNILWSEFARWYNKLDKNLEPQCVFKAKALKDDHLVVETQRIFVQQLNGKECFAFWKTANPKDDPDSQAGTLYGFHAPNMLIVVDEAASVPQPVFKPLEGTITSAEGVNWILMLFNPIYQSGYAVDSHTGPNAHKWILIQWDAEESENVSKQHIIDMEQKYGRNSNTFRTLVRGLPPLAEADTLIPYDWVMNAVDRDIIIEDDDPVIMGLDVGGGGDNSVACIRQGWKVKSFEKFSSPNTMEVVGWAAELMDGEKVTACFVDVIGIGNGVYYRLKELGYSVYPVDVRVTCLDERFRNVRSELWWKAREAFESNLPSIPNDLVFKSELWTPKFKHLSGKTIEVESKYDMKRRLSLSTSPNHADAFNLTLTFKDSMFRRQKREDYDMDKTESKGDFGWMAA